jgi:hypothetical protein
MKRFLLGALAMGAVFVLTSFAVRSQERALVVRHEPAATYVWEMNGSEVVGLTTYEIRNTTPNDLALLKRRYTPQEWSKK